MCIIWVHGVKCQAKWVVGLYSRAGSACRLRNEAERRHEGGSSVGGSASSPEGEGARPFGGFASASFRISGAAAGLSARCRMRGLRMRTVILFQITSINIHQLIVTYSYLFVSTRTFERLYEFNINKNWSFYQNYLELWNTFMWCRLKPGIDVKVTSNMKSAVTMQIKDYHYNDLLTCNVHAFVSHSVITLTALTTLRAIITLLYHLLKMVRITQSRKQLPI